MTKPKMDVEPNLILFDKQTIFRPACMSASEWIDWWDSVKDVDPCEVMTLKQKLNDALLEIRELENLVEDLRDEIRELEDD